MAITSSIHPDEFTHIEPVRYGKGSNAMSLLQTALTDGDGRGPRWWRWLRTIATQPSHLTWFSPRRWSERTVILLVMQTLDNSITALNSALGEIGAQAKQIEAHNTFVTKLVDTLESGVGNLVDADLAKESARLQALQVQQQLGAQALSIANQAPQVILSLFRS